MRSSFCAPVISTHSSGREGEKGAKIYARRDAITFFERQCHWACICQTEAIEALRSVPGARSRRGHCLGATRRRVNERRRPPSGK